MPQPIVSTAPHSTDAERTLIGALLLDADAIFNVANSLYAQDFYDPVYRDVYAAMQELAEEGTSVDFVTVANRLKDNEKFEQLGGSAFLADLASSVPTSSHAAQYAEIIREKSRRRQLSEIGRNVDRLAQEDRWSADELTEMAEQKIMALSRRTAHDAPVSLGALRHERYDHYAKLHDGDASVIRGVTTGFHDIDAKLTSLAPQQLIVLAGRPGMGKTALALDIALHVAARLDEQVLVFSLEMSRDELFGRVLAKELGVESWKLEKGILQDDAFTRMGTVMDRFENCPLFIDDDCDTSLTNIRSKARRHKLQHGLSLLVVDYLQLIEVTDRRAGENQTQRITYISKTLKRLARELDCPVLALSQLSRECEKRIDKRPLLSDLRDSGSIEQDGDRILMLYRDSEYNENCSDPDVTDVFIRKNRHGPTGFCELRFDCERMSFNDLVRDDTTVTEATVVG